VPRRAFFDALGVDRDVEERVVNASATPLARVVVERGTHRAARPLTSTDATFVYDKGRLASALFEAAAPFRRCAGEPVRPEALIGFDRVLDCRGAKATLNDPIYTVISALPARTRCVYLIADRPREIDPDAMRAWSADAGPEKPRTAFMVPFVDGRMSFGCSSRPHDVLGQEFLRREADRLSLWSMGSAVHFQGEAMPAPTTVISRVATVIPIGDTRSLSCPLNTYGVLRALSDALVVAGRAPLPVPMTLRPLADEIDPHVPVELFA
jgi:hypothetical protein